MSHTLRDINVKKARCKPQEKQDSTYLLTYSMEQSRTWEANRFSASREIPRILWKPKVH